MKKIQKITYLLCFTTSMCIYAQRPLNAKTRGFEVLKSMINGRQNEAKVYIPDRATVGSKIEIIVDAPDASKITLLQAFNAGTASYEGMVTRLDESLTVVEEVNKAGHVFTVDVTAEKYASYLDKDIYFDAIVEYPSEYGIGNRKKLANFFGANAAYSNLNTVRIIKPAKSTAGTETLIRSIAPGLLNRPTQY